MKKSDNVPELRFPQFVNDGEWEEEKLGQISEIVRGSSPRPIQDYTTNDSDGLNWLKIADVPSGSKYITGTKEKVVKEALNSTREVNPGDLILSNSMSFGRPYILKIKTCIHDGWIAIRKISNKTFEDYLYYFISSESSQSYFHTNAAGAAVKNLNAEIIKLLPIYLPKEKKEQQKIASCLSSLDEVIAAHNEKLEALKDYKKGLMQNLFPQEGEKVPKYRFPEFENDGRWIERKLEELAKRGSGHTPNKQISSYYNGGIKWVSLADSNKLDNRYIYDTKIQISKDGIENSSAVLHPAGTVILSRDAGVGKSAVLYSEMAVSQHFIVWICDESKLSNWFLYYVFQILKPVFESIAVGSTIKTIGLPYFKELLILVPSINEQLKIASCLSSLDELITAQTKKIAQLKLHKKSLMQRLFP